MFEWLHRLRKIAIPHGSIRDQVLMLLENAYDVLKQEGWRVTAQRTYHTLRAYWRVGILKQFFSKPYTYADWIADHEPDARELLTQQQTAQTFTYTPVISLITPVYNPPPDILTALLESARAQTYPHWEFCLINGGSDVAGVQAVLDKYVTEDDRFRVNHLERNLGIAGNSNEALAMAQGEFIALVDHDDILAPNMLFEVVKLLNEHRDADIIYFDEDKISADGTVRRAPFFKPSAWSPDLLLSTNYLMHSVIRHSLITAVDGFDVKADGAQDWDLLLRCTEQTQRIYHIPKILYHWRQMPGSAARDANAKPWAFEAQARSLEAHLDRIGVADAKVTFPSLGLVHIQWPISDTKASIIIPTKDNIKFLRTCITSIIDKTTYANYEIVLVDTGSTAPETLHYYQTLASFSSIGIVEYEGPFNYSRANNLGAYHATGDILVFLNNDVQMLESGWLAELVGWAQRSQVGVVGPKLLYPDKSIQQAGIVMGLQGHGSHVFEGAHEYHYGPFGSTEWYRNYLAVTGACMAMRRDVFEAIGGFDEAYRIGYSDIEICLRAHEAGYRIVYTPFARLIHHEGGSRGKYLPPSDVLRATIQMLPVIQAGDPYFNENLSYLQRNPIFARPNEESREERLLRILSDFALIDLHVNALPDDTRACQLAPLRRSHLSLTSHVSASNRTKHWRPKILIVSHDLSLSGAPLCLWLLTCYLVQHEYDVTVLAPSRGPLYEKYRSQEIEVIFEDKLLSDVRVLIEHVERHDVVLANTILTWRVIHTARALTTPSVWWIHESRFGTKMAHDHNGIAEGFATADAVVFPSRYTAKLYREFSERNNFAVIHNGITPPLKKTFFKGKDINDAEFRIVNVASIEPRKGQDVLLQAIAALSDEVRRQVTCTLIGRPLDRAYYKRILKIITTLPNVTLLGEIPNEDVLRYLVGADVFVLSSRDEALPISLLEAMSLGKAIVSTDAGGIGEILEHGVNGLLVETGDADALAQEIERLFYNHHLLQQLSENAYSTFTEYLTVSRFGTEFADIIESIATGQKSG